MPYYIPPMSPPFLRPRLGSGQQRDPQRRVDRLSLVDHLLVFRVFDETTPNFEPHLIRNQS